MALETYSEALDSPSESPKSPRILGVLAGDDVSLDRLAIWANSAEVVLAADGAADRLRQVEVTPDATIGDLDSLVDRDGLRELVFDPDQSTSDADKLLAYAAAKGYRAITLIGIEGGRFDHVLGSLASAARADLAVTLVLSSSLGWIVRPGKEMRIATEPEDFVSLMPLDHCSNVWLTGVRWPLDAAELALCGQVSLSNRALGVEVTCSIGSGAAVLIQTPPVLTEPQW